MCLYGLKEELKATRYIWGLKDKKTILSRDVTFDDQLSASEE